MEDNSSYFYEDLLAQIPFELQVSIFSCIKLQDLVRFASTSHYWNTNAWTFTMSLGANEFSEFVNKVADEASYDFAVTTDLFSEPVPMPVIDVKPQREFKVFHFLFEKVELSPQKVPHFEIEVTGGFDEIKDEFMDALTTYSGFLNEVRSLKLSKLKFDDIQRILWYTTSLQSLEIESEKVGHTYGLNFWREPTRSRNTVPFALYTSIDFSNCPNLEVITCRGFSVVESDLMTVLKTAKNLKALSFISGEFNLLPISVLRSFYFGEKLTYLAIRDSEVQGKFDNMNPNSTLFRIFSTLKTIDLRACTYAHSTTKESAEKDLKFLFPQADVLVDENEYYEFDLNA